MKPRIVTKCVASSYEMTDEKIIEFSHKNGGGLISFTPQPDGKLCVVLYRCDDTVVIHTPKPARAK